MHLAQVEGAHLVDEGLRARAIEIEGGGRDEVGAQLARRPIQLPVLVGTQCHLVRGTGRDRGRSRGRARGRARGKARVLPASGRPQHRCAGRRLAAACRVA